MKFLNYLSACFLGTVAICMGIYTFSSCSKKGVIQEPLKADMEYTRFDISKGKPIRPPKDTIPVTVTTGKAKCMWLNFNGATVNSPYWNNGVPFTVASSGMDAAHQASALQRAQSFYAKYNIVVTMDKAVYDTCNSKARIQTIITTTHDFIGSGNGAYSGVTFNGSFFYGDGTPNFVFSDLLYYDVSYVGDIVGHEGGHAVYLHHQTNADGSLLQGVIMGFCFSSISPVWITTAQQDDNQILATNLGLK